MTAAFIATLAIAVVLVALLAWRERFWRGSLARARRNAAKATKRAEEAERLQYDAEASVQQQIEATATLTAEMAAKTNEQVGSLEEEMAELRETSNRRIEELESMVNDARAESEARAVKGDAGTGWPLLLARVERQWADVVNAGPDERGITEAPRMVQLVQAVERDLERLREEVGVETTLAPGEPVEATDPMTTLLAVGEAVALLAGHSEHVQVDLRAPAVVSGQDWTGDDDALRRLDQFAAAASAAGLEATVQVADRAAQVQLGTAPSVASSDTTDDGDG